MQSFAVNTQGISGSYISHFECERSRYTNGFKLTVVCSNDISRDRTEEFTSAEACACINYSFDLKFDQINELSFSNCKFSKFPKELLNKFSRLAQFNGQSLGLEEFFLPNAPITHFNLSSNRISYIDSTPLAGRPSLMEVDLSSNLISTVPVFSSSGIKKIYLHDNLIQEIGGSSFSSLFELEELQLASNQLKRATIRLPVDNALLTLDLSGNNIDKVRVGDFLNLPNLKELNLKNSKIEEIELGAFSPLHNLRILDLSNNSLSKIDFNEFLPTHLRLNKLILHGNELTELDDRFDRLFYSIQDLVITNNRFNCSYLKHFLNTIQLQPGIFKLNTNYRHTPNIHGIECELTPDKIVDTPKVGFENGYNIAIFALLLCLALTNLVICATNIFIGRRKK